eukprot:TRINITY_DN5217_c0_g1_i1.p1 TRINITY_DN5217_c0_g1~~TRINITY_DN5217_c0_g1_i1.p1  ORF type:complete len:339 (+),score=54.81 TRINITY_DN5217_c0_g1_i1:644-1660(+)
MTAIEFSLMLDKARMRAAILKERDVSPSPTLFGDDGPPGSCPVKKQQCICCGYEHRTFPTLPLSAEKGGHKRLIDPGLEAYRVGDVDSIYYIPEYINGEMESWLLEQVYSQGKDRWVQLRGRRLQLLGGVPTVGREGTRLQRLPCYMRYLSRMFKRDGLFRKPPNHCLLNEYDPGQGISAHKDGPKWKPYVVVLNLGGTACFHLARSPQIGSAHDEEGEGSGGGTSVFLRPRSLLIFTADAYHHYKHSIAPTVVDVIGTECCNTDLAGVRVGESVPRESVRVSLTMRHVSRGANEDDDDDAENDDDDDNSDDDGYFETQVAEEERKRLERIFLSSIND